MVERQRILKKPQVERHTFLGAGPRNSIVAGQAEACHWQTWEKSMMMTPPLNTAERFGRWLGRGWQSYARGEGRVVEWLAARGVPATMAKALAWIFRLVVLAALLYVSFWIALLGIALAVFAVRGSAHHEDDLLTWPILEIEDPREFIDYDPNFYNDISDANYRDRDE
ncbi:DUF3742 family protein [Pseudomonas aeruginosa]